MTKGSRFLLIECVCLYEPAKKRNKPPVFGYEKAGVIGSGYVFGLALVRDFLKPGG